MKRSSLMIGLGLGVLLARATVVHAASAPAGAAQEEDPAAALEASQRALTEVDFGRLSNEREYAAQLLQHIERLERAVQANSVQSRALEGMRLVTLTTLERNDEVRALVDRMLARRSREVGAYAGPIYATLRTQDWPRAVATVETASQNVPGIGWADLRRLFERPPMFQMFSQLKTANENALRVRLAAALFRIGWPGDGQTGSTDFLRSILIEDRLDQGDRAGAIDFAAGISSPSTVLSMIVRPRYDDILAPGRDRLELLRNALAEEDRTTAEALAGSPQDHERILDRVHYLRSVGRNEDALALIRPFTRDMAATVEAGEHAMWLINEAAYAMIALGRNDEAVALMARLVDRPMDEHPQLISMSINYSEMLFTTGRFAQALTHATRLESAADGFANDYGKMWIASSIACSLARLDRAAEAAPQLERLRAHKDINPAALSQAFLCVGDVDSAAALMVERLEKDDPSAAIMVLQRYSRSSGDAQTGGHYDLLEALRDRPSVRAALDRVGRVYELPLTRSYWGSF